jgi:hypothetical protein
MVITVYSLLGLRPEKGTIHTAPLHDNLTGVHGNPYGVGAGLESVVPGATLTIQLVPDTIRSLVEVPAVAIQGMIRAPVVR